MLSYQIAVQQRHWAATGLQEFGAKDISNRGFSGTRKSGKENGYALFVPWRITAPQFMNHLWIGEPGRNIASFIQTVAQVGAGNVQHSSAILYFVLGDV